MHLQGEDPCKRLHPLICTKYNPFPHETFVYFFAATEDEESESASEQELEEVKYVSLLLDYLKNDDNLPKSFREKGQ